MGLLAFAALSTLAPAARAQTAYNATVTDLSPAGYSDASVFGVSGSHQVGGGATMSNGPTHALLWTGTAASVVDISPAAFPSSGAFGVSGDAQVGSGVPAGTGRAIYRAHALLWHGTAASVVDLTPAGYRSASASGVDGDAQIGTGIPTGLDEFSEHALLWHGTAASVVDLNPAGIDYSVGTGVSGDTQVGTGNGGYALLWHGTADSAVVLNPAGYLASEARAVSGDTQVGDTTLPSTGELHAVLWHGTAASYVDLHPAGFQYSYASGVSGGVQVGTGVFGGVSTIRHALLWQGTAASVLDLNAYLPTGYNTSSEAYSVDSVNGVVNVVGSGSGSKGQKPFLWHLVPGAPFAIASLSPDVVDAGSSAFTLTVNGTQFIPTTFVRWNGQALATTYVSATQVTALVPASLVAHTGTAGITAQTPHVATSGTTPFHIRPVIASLSPSTRAAGSGTFTLTVNGAGFTTSSIVVFQGTNLATTFTSSTKLTAAVPASLVTAGRKSVMVTIPHVATSRGAAFVVSP